MVKRKGIGYSIEAILALTTLFIFALGNTPSEPTQNWNSFQNKLSAKDLGHTLKNTGDLRDMVETRHTGSLKTTVSTLSSNQLDVSGTVSNLPLDTVRIGINSIPSGEPEADIFYENMNTVDSSERCSGDLEEIENESDILWTDKHSTRVYIADTDPQISGGGNGETDYDTLYVDKNTACQFSREEGPYYIDEFFNWTNSTSNHYYEFKNVTGNSGNKELVVHDGKRAVRLRNVMKSSNMTGIRTSQSFTTFKLSDEDLSEYDLIIFDKRESLNQINNTRDKVDSFISEKPVILLMDLQETDFDSSSSPNYEFIEKSGMEWIALSKTSGTSQGFGESSFAKEVRTYFNGMEGKTSSLSINSDSVTSSNSDTVLDDKKLFLSGESYDTSSWDAENSNMDEKDNSDIEGNPETACTNPEVFSEGNIGFSNYSDGSTENYKIAITELGKDSTFCNNNNKRALNIDLDGDEEYFKENEGPYLDGGEIIVEKKRYRIKIQGWDHAKFEYIGNSDVETVNRRESFENMNINSLIRFPYKDEYNQDERKLLASMIYREASTELEFGQPDTQTVSTTVYGGFNRNTYLPYEVSLRWK